MVYNCEVFRCYSSVYSGVIQKCVMFSIMAWLFTDLFSDSLALLRPFWGVDMPILPNIEPIHVRIACFFSLNFIMK